MSEHHVDGPDETLITAAAERFDFSALAHLDAASVPVITVALSGLVCAPRGQAPFAATLGESCGERGCRYRAHDVTLHASRHALLAGFAERAAASGLPLGLVLDELGVNVWSLASRGQVRCADLEHHPILNDVPLSAERLDSQPAASAEWELVRIVRDVHATRAIRLASSDLQAQRLIVHGDLAGELDLERRGALAEVMPIVPAGFGTGSLAANFARRLRRSTD